MYRLVLQLCRYYHRPEAERQDPFRAQKEGALRLAGDLWREKLLPMCKETEKAAWASSELCVCLSPARSHRSRCCRSFKKVLLHSLWGNQCDLSLSAGKVRMQPPQWLATAH